MNKKYRIIVRTFEDGSESYMPQCKFLFMWYDMYEPYGYFSLGEARGLIEETKATTEAKRTVLEQPTRE